MMGTTGRMMKDAKKEVGRITGKTINCSIYINVGILEKDIRLGKTKWIKIMVKGQQRFLIFSRNNFQKKDI